jgi:hypothetical protein
MPCSGNSLQYCGAGNRLELYVNNSTSTTPSPPTPSQKAVVSGTAGVSWAFRSCYTEATSSRALAGASYADDEMTLESCASFCSDNSWGYFGTEYGRECYCGNGFAAGSVATDEKECGMGCAGDGGEVCGAGGRLSVYARQ